MALGTIDAESSKINVTNYIVMANKQYAINLPVGNYVWIILSNDSTYGDNYTLQYNMSLPKDTTNLLYVSEDYQKIYTLSNGSLKLNGQVKNMDYKYTIDWKTTLPSGESAWHKENIWMENPNIAQAVHIGGFQFKYGTKNKTYPKTLVFSIGEGGTFTHYLDQNPPRVFHNRYDVAGKYTPRTIDSDDIKNRGGHYLVYDLSTDSVVEFVSGLSREWSTTGDKGEPKLIK